MNGNFSLQEKKYRRSSAIYMFCKLSGKIISGELIPWEFWSYTALGFKGQNNYIELALEAVSYVDIIYSMFLPAQ